METEKFSVSMCVYGLDNPQWFIQAVDSILNQSVKPDEVVLVVDGPVPEELHKAICDYETNQHFRVIRFAENKGHGYARRAGLQACTNDLVALMDADDISAENRFEKQLRMFSQDPKLDIVGGNITEFIGEPSNLVSRRLVPETDGEIKERLKKQCPMNQMTVMFRKTSVEQVGGYVDWYSNEDYYLWVRMVQANMTFANVTDDLVNVRVGKDMYRRRGGVRYFKSEAKLQKYMLDNHIITRGTYCVNLAKRLIVQVFLPNDIRGWVFQKFARKKV